MTFFDCANEIIRPTFERMKASLESENKSIRGVITLDANRCRLDITETEGEAETRYFMIHFSGHYPEDENVVRMIPQSMLHYETVIGQNRSRAFALADITPSLIESIANALMDSD